MTGCRVVELLIRVLPFRAWRGRLEGRHLDACPRCRDRLASPEEAGRFVIRPETAGPAESFWPFVEAGIERRLSERRRSGSRPGRSWRRAAGLAAVAAAAAVMVWTFKPVESGKNRRPEIVVQEFRLDSIEVEGNAARAFIYQPRDSSILMIWVGESR